MSHWETNGKSDEAPEFWFRYEDRLFTSWEGVISEVGEPLPEPYRFRVKRKTACGVVLDVWGVEKFVRSGSRKRFAYPDTESAERSYLRRKVVHVRILLAQLERAEGCLARAKELCGAP